MICLLGKNNNPVGRNAIGLKCLNGSHEMDLKYNVLIGKNDTSSKSLEIQSSNRQECLWSSGRNDTSLMKGMTLAGITVIQG